MPWCVPWHAKTSWCRTNFFLARAICPKCVPKFIIRHLEGVPSFKSKVGSGALVGVHGMPWCVPWHAKTSWCRTNFFLARAICPKCVSKFIIRHLEGVPSFKSKVGSGALVGAMACLGVCHGMPWWVPWHAKTSRCCTNFFLARAICPNCVSKFIVRYLEGFPSLKSNSPLISYFL
jgi:hypothetical protein